MAQPQMSIGEVASRVGIHASAIRFYERTGLLMPPLRINGRRRYEAVIVQQIRFIQLAQQAGFTISEIRTLLYEFPSETPPSVRWQKLANHKLEEIDGMLNRLNTMKTLLERALRCECPTLEDCARAL